MASVPDPFPLSSSVRALIYSLLLVLVALHPLCAAEVLSTASTTLPDQVYFRNLTIDDGLSVNNVISITQDNDGFMWLGTENGLNRYDGYNFTVVGNDPKSPSRYIGKSIIYTVYTNESDSIWIGSEYLLRYDKRLERMTRFDITADMGIRVIKEDREGNLWLGGAQFGLRRFDPQQETLVGQFYHADPENPSHSDAINDLHFARNGGIWVASDEGLFFFDPVLTEFSRPVTHPKLDQARVTGLASDDQGRLWIGTWEGLFRYDSDSEDLIHFPVTSLIKNSEHPFQIHSLISDSHGNIWIGTDKQGVVVWEAVNDTFKHYPACINDPYCLGVGAVFDIYEDRDHSIWFGIQGFGVYRFDPHNQCFTYFPPNPDNPEMLNYPVVLSVEEGTDNELWVATDGGGLNLVKRNPVTGDHQITHFVHDPKDPYSVSSNSIIGLALDTNSEALWLGTWAGGLNKYSPDTGRFVNWRKGSSQLVTDNIFTLMIDSKQQLWISCWDAGVQIFDLASETIRTTLVGNPAAGPNAMHNNHVMAIFEDRDGIIWMGGYNGLDRYDPKTGKFTNFNSGDKVVAPLSSNTIFTIHQSHDGTLWIGTDRGLNLFHPENGNVTVYTQQQGLPNDNIMGILEDCEHVLWLSTRNGLSRFDPQTGEVRNYFAEEGLQSNEFTRFAYEQLSTGEMVFGGVNGFNLFVPCQAFVEKVPPTVSLTNLFVFNELVRVGEGSRLTEAVNMAERINLLPDDHTFSLSFSALEYGTPDSLRYRYRMKGIDPKWLETDSSNRLATYTQLGPGTYTFAVQAKHENSGWGPEKNTLIAVASHWWETFLFKAFMVIVLATLIYGIYWSRLHRLKAKLEARQKAQEAVFFRARNVELGQMNSELEALAQEKEDLLHMVAHDLRNPLTAIQLNMDLLSMGGPNMDEQERKTMFSQIHSMTGRMIETINASLKEKRPPEEDQGGVVPVQQELIPFNRHVRRMVSEFEVVAAKKDIVLCFESSCTDQVMVKGSRTSFQQIIDNLVSNAVKFSHPGSKAFINCSLQDGFATLTVTDQGPGLTKEDKLKMFGKRAKLSAKPTAGEHSSGIGLFTTKKLVENLSGTITVHSQGLGYGTTFTVCLPAEITKKK